MRGIFEPLVDLVRSSALGLAGGRRAKFIVPALLAIAAGSVVWLHSAQNFRQVEVPRDSAPSSAAMPTAPAGEDDRQAAGPKSEATPPRVMTAPPPAFRDTRPLTSPEKTAPDKTAQPVTVSASLPGKLPSSSTTAAPAVAAPAATVQPAAASPGFRDARPLVSEKTAAKPALQEPAKSRPSAPNAAPTQAPAVVATPAIAQPATPPIQTAAASVPVPTIAMPVSQPAAEPTPPRKTIAGVNDCNTPGVAVEPLDGGRTRVVVSSPCRAAETVKISYAGVDYVRRLDASGYGEANLDLFAGAKRSADVEFADGARRVIPVAANDLDSVTKVAVRWRAPVNLDLHVFEYAAAVGQPGHVWSKSRSTLVQARDSAAKTDRGHGYLSTVADGTSEGDRLEVYTFFHNEQQAAGTVALAIDYETRGATPTPATCGQGEHAKIEFQFFTLSRQGDVAQGTGALKPVACGITIDAAQRFNQSMLPMLRIRR